MPVNAEGLPKSAPVWLEIEIETIRQETPSIKAFGFKVPWGKAFLPGQCIDFRLTAEDGYTSQRYYSIATAPAASGFIEVLVERRDGGEVSSFFHDTVVEGDRLEVRGPVGGAFTWGSSETGPVLLIGGGSGVSPLLSMIRHRIATGWRKPFTLLYSSRTNDEILALGELRDLAQHDKAFRLVIAVTREEPLDHGILYGRFGRHHIRAAMTGQWANPAACFICGSNGFVGDLSDLLLEEGVAMHRIRTERFGG